MIKTPLNMFKIIIIYFDQPNHFLVFSLFWTSNSFIYILKFFKPVFASIILKVVILNKQSIFCSDRKFPKSVVNAPKVKALADQFFPQDQNDQNVLLAWWQKIKGQREVTIEDFVKAFPQDLLQECTCYDIIIEDGLW